MGKKTLLQLITKFTLSILVGRFYYTTATRAHTKMRGLLLIYSSPRQKTPCTPKRLCFPMGIWTSLLSLGVRMVGTRAKQTRLFFAISILFPMPICCTTYIRTCTILSVLSLISTNWGNAALTFTTSFFAFLIQFYFQQPVKQNIFSTMKKKLGCLMWPTRCSNRVFPSPPPPPFVAVNNS